VARAAALQSQSLSLSWALRNKRGMAVSAEVLACLAGIQGRAERAARLFGVATALLDAANYLLPPTLFELHRRGEGAARGAWATRHSRPCMTRGGGCRSPRGSPPPSRNPRRLEGSRSKASTGEQLQVRA
jgi:hypothetical protein